MVDYLAAHLDEATIRNADEQAVRTVSFSAP